MATSQNHIIPLDSQNEARPNYDLVTLQNGHNATSEYILNMTLHYGETLTSIMGESFATLNSSNPSADEYYNDDDWRSAHDRRIHTKFYLLGIILPCGLFFNTFAFIVFLRSPNIHKTTTGRFLMSLTIADNMFLIGEFLRWLNTADTKGMILGLDFMEESLGWCGTIYYIRYYGQLVSGWLTVAITVERFIGIGFPLKAHRISTKASTHLTIALIYIISASVTCFPYWTLRINRPEGELPWCEYTNKNELDTWVWVIIRVCSLLLPSAFIFIFTGLIIYKLYQITRSREALARFGSRGKKNAIERQLTVMLVAVSITFLILRLPYTLLYYLFDFREEIWGEHIEFDFEHKLWFTRDVCDVLATTNYTVNFFLYCLTGSQFRATCYYCVRCESIQKRHMRTFKSTYVSNTALTAVTSRSSSSLSLNGHSKIYIRPYTDVNGTSKL